MQLKKLKIGRIETPNNVFVAPLAGYTNCVFRSMCISLGAGLTFTEMVSAKGLCYGSENTADLLRLPPDYGGIKAVQLFGGDPEFMRRAACCEEIAPFSLIDINMGCPVPKIFKNGEGSALLADIAKAQSLVVAAKQSGKAVSVKFRIGIDEKSIITRDFAVAMQDAGADMITVHGRTRDKIYSGDVDYAQIAAAKSAVEIPVIANGGVFGKEDADELADKTGADGIMLARAVMYNPFLLADITGTFVADKKEVIGRQLAQTFETFDQRFAVVYMRKMLGFYVKGQPNASALRTRLLACQSREEIEEVFRSMNF